MQFKGLSCIQRPNFAKCMTSTYFVWQEHKTFSIASVINSTIVHEILQVRSFHVLLTWHQRVNMSRQSMFVCNQSEVCLQGWRVQTLEISGSWNMPGCWLLIYVPFKFMITSLNHRKGRILKWPLTLKAHLFQCSWTLTRKHYISLFP